MRKNPKLINNVSVKYFRSINSEKISLCEPLNIITGSNDVGKSNFLRALNLFFNNQSDNGVGFKFSEDFSHSRLDSVRRESVKGRQFIQIEIEFNCENSFKKTLPKKFKVRKTWYRDSLIPLQTHDLDKHIRSGQLKTTLTKAEGGLQRFLNSIVFTYIPAIKDKDIFRSVIGDLQEVLFAQSESNSGLLSELETFSLELEKQASELRYDFRRLTGVDTRISLPKSYKELFRAFDISTEGNFDESVALNQRGDGVRVRYLPAMLNYIAERSPKLHVWGFEEPENSMEFRRAFELAQTMRDTYTQNAQIFVTTHSPAFIDLDQKNQSIYMASRNDCDTTFNHLNKKGQLNKISDDPFLLIADELGHIQLMSDLHEKLQEKITRADEAIASRDIILHEMSQMQMPVLLTEGKSDVRILEEAWKKLRNSPMPFTIRSCNVLHSDTAEAAGAGQLCLCLRGIRADNPHLVFGLFDRDKEGEDGWKLDKNFTQNDLFSDVKVSQNRKAVGLLLPVPDHSPEFSFSKNLTIEFLFERKDLDTTVDGKGLKLEPMPIIELCGSVEVGRKLGTNPWQMKIVSGKKDFSEHVVPSLPPASFSAFEPIFVMIEEMIKELN